MAGCLGEDMVAYKYMTKYCTRYNTTLTIEDMQTSYQYFTENVVLTSSIANFNKSIPIEVPVKDNVTKTKLYHDAYVMFLGNLDHSLYYGAGILGYWGLIFLVAIIANWLVVLFPKLRTAFNGTYSKAWRKYVTLPALVRKKKLDHQKCLGLFDLLVPSRLESIIVFVFFWLTFACCTAEIHYVANDPIYPRASNAIMRYVADRTGIVCTICLPLLILIGGRNNFLQWLTRWKFSTFIMYHRWVARVIVLLAFLHSVLYTAIYVRRGTYAEEAREEFFIFGIIATAAGGLICFQGLLYLRRRWYESFLIIHIILAACFVMGAWVHVDDFGYMWFMYACVAVWCFDRFVRIVRMLWFGFPSAQITLIGNDTLRVVVPKPSHWPSIPGGHAWLYFGHSWYFWQSHPFTFLDSSSEENSIVFLIKVKTGATLYICKKLARLPGKSMRMRVSVEGPYGEPCPVRSHSSAVFLAGGNGIPGIYLEVFDLARHSTSHQALKLYWIVRESASIAWMFQELEALRSTKIETIIYVTRPDDGCDNEVYEMISRALEQSSSEEKEDKMSGCLLDALRGHFPHVEFRSGRPGVEEIVQAEVEECNNSVAFVSCGHPAMVDDLRYAVLQSIDKTEKRVDFYEQLQVWA